MVKRLTDNDVKLMRIMLNEQYKTKFIREYFSCSKETVCRIKNLQLHKDVIVDKTEKLPEKIQKIYYNWSVCRNFLPNETIKLIKLAIKNNIKSGAIALYFGLDRQVIYQIKNKHLYKKIEPDKNQFLPEEIIRGLEKCEDLLIDIWYKEKFGYERIKEEPLEKRAYCNLTEQQVKAIKLMFKENIPISFISKILDINISNVSNVVNGVTHKKITLKPTEKISKELQKLIDQFYLKNKIDKEKIKRKTRMKAETVRLIKLALRENIPNSILSAYFDTASFNISNIKREVTYKNVKVSENEKLPEKIKKGILEYYV